MLKEVHHLLQILLGVFITRNVIKYYPLFIKAVQLGLTLAKAHRLAVLSLGLAHHKHKENAKQYDRQNNWCEIPKQ